MYLLFFECSNVELLIWMLLTVFRWYFWSRTIIIRLEAIAEYYNFVYCLIQTGLSTYHTYYCNVQCTWTYSRKTDWIIIGRVIMDVRDWSSIGAGDDNGAFLQRLPAAAVPLTLTTSPSHGSIIAIISFPLYIFLIFYLLLIS